MNFIKDIWYAISSPEKYRDFMTYKRKKVFGYVLILTLITGFINFGIPGISFVASGGYERVFNESIPNFTASSEDGFWIEEPIEIDEYNFLIKADSSVVKEDITDVDGQFGAYSYVVVVDKEQLHISAPGMEEITARFDEMEGFSLTKDDILKYVPVAYAVSVALVIFGMLFDFIYYLAMAAVAAMLAGFISSFMKVKIPRKEMLHMAVYAWTLPYLLIFAQQLTGIYVPNYTLFSYIITMGYLYFAIKEMKENGIEELPPEAFGGREDNL
ncbi:MAG: DUF1189 family protein [Lachnospiraceae bacterium]|nr:DUF1189 family protein [Lachnospiraceae bacterium]